MALGWTANPILNGIAASVQRRSNARHARLFKRTPEISRMQVDARERMLRKHPRILRDECGWYWYTERRGRTSAWRAISISSVSVDSKDGRDGKESFLCPSLRNLLLSLTFVHVSSNRLDSKVDERCYDLVFPLMLLHLYRDKTILFRNRQDCLLFPAGCLFLFEMARCHCDVNKVSKTLAHG